MKNSILITTLALLFCGTLQAQKFKLNTNNPPIDKPYRPSKIPVSGLAYAKNIEVYVNIALNTLTPLEIKAIVAGNNPKIKVYYFDPSKNVLQSNGVVYGGIEKGYLTLKYPVTINNSSGQGFLALTVDENVLKSQYLAIHGDRNGRGGNDCQMAFNAQTNILGLPEAGFVKIFDETKKDCGFFREFDDNKIYRFHLDYSPPDR